MSYARRPVARGNSLATPWSRFEGRYPSPGGAAAPDAPADLAPGPSSEPLLDLRRADSQREPTSAVEQAKGVIIAAVFHRGGKPIRDFRRAWVRACVAAGLGRAEKNADGKVVAAWRSGLSTTTAAQPPAT